MQKCHACMEAAIYSVLLAGDSDRLYLPNQNSRDASIDIREVWFCRPCMRAVEDNLRATILYLQKEGGSVWGKKK